MPSSLSRRLRRGPRKPATREAASNFSRTEKDGAERHQAPTQLEPATACRPLRTARRPPTRAALPQRHGRRPKAAARPAAAAAAQDQSGHCRAVAAAPPASAPTRPPYPAPAPPRAPVPPRDGTHSRAPSRSAGRSYPPRPEQGRAPQRHHLEPTVARTTRPRVHLHVQDVSVISVARLRMEGWIQKLSKTRGISEGFHLAHRCGRAPKLEQFRNLVIACRGEF